jgi:hypothetical protein
MRCDVRAIHFLSLANRVAGFGIFCLVLTTSHRFIFAHTTSISYSEIDIKERTIQLRLRLNLYEVNFAAQLDGNSDRVLSESEVKSSFPKWVDRVFDNIQIDCQGRAGKATLNSFTFVPDTGALECLASYSFPQLLEDIRFRVTLHNLTDSGHLNLALIQYDSRQEQRFFNLENSEARVELRRTPAGVLRRWGRWLLIGGRRVIGSYECLAFLFGLLLVNQNFENQTRSSLAFLLSQMVTFSIGAFNVAVLPERFLGSAIALSVAYIAIENLLIKEISNRWLIALFFGLIFGFSFSSPNTGLGISQNSRAFPLFTIGLGITFAVGSLVVLMSLTFRYFSHFRCFKQIITLASLLLMSFGFFTFARRTF